MGSIASTYMISKPNCSFRGVSNFLYIPDNGIAFARQLLNYLSYELFNKLCSSISYILLPGTDGETNMSYIIQICLKTNFYQLCTESTNYNLIIFVLILYMRA